MGGKLPTHPSITFQKIRNNEKKYIPDPLTSCGSYSECTTNTHLTTSEGTCFDT